MIGLIKKILKSSNFLSLAGNLSFAVFNAVTFLLLARTLSKELFGEWIIYVTAASLLNMLQVGLTSTGAIRAISISAGKENNSFIGASYQLGFYSSIAIAVLFYPSWYILQWFFPQSYYYPVLLFYPLLALLSLPYNQAKTITQAKVNFGGLLAMKLLHGLSMLIFIGIYINFHEPSIEILILLHALSNFLPGVLSLIKGWDGIKHFKEAGKQQISELLNFGKYSTLISVGSSLLRSADTFILSMSVAMGPAAIAIYAIPMKFVEAVEIPLRSFSATAYPKLSQAIQKGTDRFNEVLHSYNLATTAMIIPIIIILLVFAEPLLLFVGGDQYIDSIGLQKNILYVILIYIFILPVDRYTGVALFALNKPVMNFYKTMIMLATNIIFDLVAVFVFQSLLFVAIGTLLFTLTGVYWGWYFIYKESGAQIKTMIYRGKPILNEAINLIRKR
jgi:O-antigen/teichoic acid export membrane protein